MPPDERGLKGRLDSPRCLRKSPSRQAAARRQRHGERASRAHTSTSPRRRDAAYDLQSSRAHWWNARLEACLELVGEGQGSLLEVGPGPGRLLAALAEQKWTVSAVDAEPAMVDLSCARVPSAKDRIVVGRAEALPFGDSRFDIVVAIGVLRYTDLTSALTELVRVLRPGGRAVIGLQNGRAPAMLWRRSVVLPAARAAKRVVPFGRALPPPRRRPLSLREAREVLTSAGLVVERVEHVSCAVLPEPLDRMAPRLAYRTARLAERSGSLRRALGTNRLFLAVKM